MKYILTESQFDTLMQGEHPTEIELFIFNKIYEKRNKLKKRADIFEYLKSLMKYLGIEDEYARYYLLAYVLNYRKDGKFSEITPETYVDPKLMKGRTTSNTMADQYTKAKIPFKGSSLEGFWRKDSKGVPIYLVVSYGWYPIYAFKEGKWYEAANSYSSSTGRQMRNSNPISWNDDLSEEVVTLTQDEMKQLVAGKTYDELMAMKLETLKKGETLSKKVRTLKPSYWWAGTDRENFTPHSIKFKISSIGEDNGIGLVTIDVLDVLLLDRSGKEVKTSENYLKGEIPNVTKEKVENNIISKLKYQFKDFVGKRVGWRDKDLPEGSKVRFVFNHLKK